MVYDGVQFCLGQRLRKPSSPNLFTGQRIPVVAIKPTKIILSAQALAHIPVVPRQAKLVRVWVIVCVWCLCHVYVYCVYVYAYCG